MHILSNVELYLEKRANFGRKMGLKKFTGGYNKGVDDDAKQMEYLEKQIFQNLLSEVFSPKIHFARKSAERVA